MRCLLCAGAVTALLAAPAAAQTWNGGGFTNSWSNGGPLGNWSGAAAPVSGPATALTFAGTTRLATTQDIADPFVLNALTFQPGAGAFSVAGGEVRFGGASNLLTQNAASPITLTAPVSFDGSGTITGSGAGSLTLSSLTARQGTLTVGRPVTVGGLTLGVDGGAAAAVATGSTVLTLAGDVTFVRLTDTPAGFADTPPARLSGVVDLGGANRTFAGIYSNQNTIGAPNVDLAIDARLTGSGGFVKGGSLTDPRAWMSLTNPLNNYTGPTILEAGSERLYLGAANVIPATSAVQVRTLSELYLTSSAVQATGVSFSQTIGSLSDGGTTGGTVRLGWADATPAVLTAGGDNTSTSFAGTIVGGGALVKVGTGTLTLSGANTYAGGTTVSSGTLLVAGQTGTDSGTGTGAVTVGPAGTLGGTGQALGPVTVRGRVMGGDGVTALGNPVLTAGGITFENNSRLRVAVGGSTPAAVVNSRVSAGAAGFNRSAASDVMVIELVNAGDLDLSGGSTYTVTVATFGSTTATPANFSVTAVNFTLADLPVVTVTGADLAVRFTPAPVPEPAAALALAAAGLAAVGLAQAVRSHSPGWAETKAS